MTTSRIEDVNYSVARQLKIHNDELQIQFSDECFMLHVAFHVSNSLLLWEPKTEQKRCKKKTLREYQFRFVRALLLHSRLFVLYIALQKKIQTGGKSRGEQEVKQNDERCCERAN